MNPDTALRSARSTAPFEEVRPLTIDADAYGDLGLGHAARVDDLNGDLVERVELDARRLLASGVDQSLSVERLEACNRLPVALSRQPDLARCIARRVPASSANECFAVRRGIPRVVQPCNVPDLSSRNRQTSRSIHHRQRRSFVIDHRTLDCRGCRLARCCRELRHRFRFGLRQVHIHGRVDRILRESLARLRRSGLPHPDRQRYDEAGCEEPNQDVLRTHEQNSGRERRKRRAVRIGE